LVVQSGGAAAIWKIAAASGQIELSFPARPLSQVPDDGPCARLSSAFFRGKKERDYSHRHEYCRDGESRREGLTRE